jgi:hypothetical protein
VPEKGTNTGAGLHPCVARTESSSSPSVDSSSDDAHSGGMSPRPLTTPAGGAPCALLRGAGRTARRMRLGQRAESACGWRGGARISLANAAGDAHAWRARGPHLSAASGCSAVSALPLRAA